MRQAVREVPGVPEVGFVGRFRNSTKFAMARDFALRALVHPVRAARLRASLSGKLRKFPSLKVHFGCGEVADARFLNVDARPFRHVDYVTKSPAMPALPAKIADMIYACHVFEHIPHGRQLKVLTRWRQMLKPEGQLLLSVPDFDKVRGLYDRGEKDFAWMQSVLMGGQDYPGNFHYALFTRERLRVLLEKAGFQDIRDWHSVEEDSWPKDWSWDESVSLNLKAERPGAG